jgi:hypothetical protein
MNLKASSADIGVGVGVGVGEGVGVGVGVAVGAAVAAAVGNGHHGVLQAATDPISRRTAAPRAKRRAHKIDDMFPA